MSTLDVTTKDQIQQIKGSILWLKLLAIIGYISGGFLCIIGVITLIFGVGIGFLISGSITVWMSTLLWSASKKLTEMEVKGAGDTALEVLTTLSSYFKITGIISALSLVISIVITIFWLSFVPHIVETLKYCTDNFSNEASQQTGGKSKEEKCKALNFYGENDGLGG